MESWRATDGIQGQNDMGMSREIEIGPTSQHETWRVKSSRPDRQSDQNIAPDAAAGLVGFDKCGFVAIDLPTDDIICAQRTHWDARRDGMNDYKILFQCSGKSTLVQDDRTAKLAAGDLGLIDLTRPISLEPLGEPGRWIGLHFPRHSLISHLGFEPRGGLCWLGDALPSRLLGRFLADAAGENAVALGTTEFYLQQAVYNLVGALFESSDASYYFSQSDKLFSRLCGIAKRRFLDPDISPVEVASEAGISVRYLQKLFATRGTTFGHFIKSLRLDHAAQLLRQQTSIKRGFPLSRVAYACGYRDYAHFARNFRVRFGCAPGAFRGCAPS
jgi:AraC family transcriptional regulator, positive regulator of tynA and feaB